MELYLWSLKFEYHIIWGYPRVYSTFDFFFQPFKNVKTILSLWTLPRHQAGYVPWAIVITPYSRILYSSQVPMVALSLFSKVVTWREDLHLPLAQHCNFSPMVCVDTLIG